MFNKTLGTRLSRLLSGTNNWFLSWQGFCKRSDDFDYETIIKREIHSQMNLGRTWVRQASPVCCKRYLPLYTYTGQKHTISIYGRHSRPAHPFMWCGQIRQHVDVGKFETSFLDYGLTSFCKSLCRYIRTSCPYQHHIVRNIAPKVLVQGRYFIW
jgi:hypothetical protein